MVRLLWGYFSIPLITKWSFTPSPLGEKPVGIRNKVSRQASAVTVSLAEQMPLVTVQISITESFFATLLSVALGSVSLERLPLPYNTDQVPVPSACNCTLPLAQSIFTLLPASAVT